MVVYGELMEVLPFNVLICAYSRIGDIKRNKYLLFYPNIHNFAVRSLIFDKNGEKRRDIWRDLNRKE